MPNVNPKKISETDVAEGDAAVSEAGVPTADSHMEHVEVSEDRPGSTEV